jgi:hypothetical protein
VNVLEPGVEYTVNAADAACGKRRIDASMSACLIPTIIECKIGAEARYTRPGAAYFPAKMRSFSTTSAVIFSIAGARNLYGATSSDAIDSRSPSR